MIHSTRREARGGVEQLRVELLLARAAWVGQDVEGVLRRIEALEGELRRLKRHHAEAIKKQNKRHEGEFFKYRASILQGT